MFVWAGEKRCRTQESNEKREYLSLKKIKMREPEGDTEKKQL